MAVSAPATTPNDSGIVLILFFMMAALTHAVVSAVSLYAAATHTRVRLLSGWANVGNACVHAFLILLLIVDQGGDSMFVSQLISKDCTTLIPVLKIHWRSLSTCSLSTLYFLVRVFCWNQ